MRYFVFCQSDLVLEKTADGYRIPAEIPVEPKPWTTVMNVDGEKAFRIDQPLLGNEHYEMCGLRQSYYRLTAEEYRRLVNAMNCSIGIRTPNTAVSVAV